MTELDRHSRAFEAELITDPELKAQKEASNGLRQFDAVAERIEYWTHPERPFKLRPSTILDLHRIALEGISAYAGNFRPAGIAIQGSQHQPAGAHLVPVLIEELCDYINENWTASSPIHLCAYTLWKLNWIHPFTDGNGRTARALSYLVLCVRLGYRLSGTKTIPEQISEGKTPYYRALEVADKGFKENNLPDLSAMEALLESLLAKQLLEVFDRAKGGVAGKLKL